MSNVDPDAQVQADAAKDARIVELERNNALLQAGQAGWEPTLAGMFAQTYTGELTPEAIKAAAALVPGLVIDTTPAPKPETVATPSEQQQTAERNGLTLGAPGGEAVPPAPKPTQVAALAAYDASKAGGETDRLANTAFFADRLKAAAEGQAGAVWTNWTPEQLAR